MLRYVCHSHSSICWRFIDQRFYIHFWKRHWTLNEYISVHMIDGLTRYMNVFFFFLCTYSTWNRSFAPWMFGQFTHPAADTLLILSAFYWSKWIPGTVEPQKTLSSCLSPECRTEHQCPYQTILCVIYVQFLEPSVINS